MAKALITAVTLMTSYISPVVVTTAHAATQQVTDMPTQKILKLFEASSVDSSLFSPSFLTHVPTPMLEKIISDLKQSLGQLRSVEITNGSGIAYFEKATTPISIALDQHNQINTLWFGAPKFKNIQLDEQIKQLNNQAIGNTSILIRVNHKPIIAQNNQVPMAVGSSFKLLVLKAYEDAIQTGNMRRDDIILLQEKNRSFASGILQTLPAQTPINLEMLAQLMIQISDNTATDHLIEQLKKSKIEALSPRNTPLLTTKSLFQLIDQDQLRQQYKSGNIKTKTQIIQQLDQQPLPVPDHIGKSATWQDVEWYMSSNEICEILESVQNAPALNSSHQPLFKTLHWPKMGYKGGSEYGVINFSFIGQTPDGREVCAVFTANGEDPQPDSNLALLFTGLLQAIETLNTE